MRGASAARREHPDARIIVVTESVFSMDGDRAPLAEIQRTTHVALGEIAGAFAELQLKGVIANWGTHGDDVWWTR